MIPTTEHEIYDAVDAVLRHHGTPAQYNRTYHGERLGDLSRAKLLTLKSRLTFPRRRQVQVDGMTLEVRHV